MNELALFAGAGGGILGGKLLGWRTVCAVEWETYPASVLCARQNDGLLESFPIWDDICSFDGKPWRGIVDVVSGGFPCQDISAGGKGEGIDGERSGMWREMARVIHEVRPKFVFVENSPMLTSRGLGRVLGDLASMGFDAKWGVLGAADIGANHQRDRIWIVARWRGNLSHSQHDRIRWWEQQQESIKKANRENVADSDCGLRGGGTTIGQGGRNEDGRLHIKKIEQTEYDLWCKTFGCSPVRRKEKMANPASSGLQGQGQFEQSIDTETHGDWKTSQSINVRKSEFWAVEPNVGRVVNGMAARVDRIKALGNGQVPLCAATAWRILNDQN